MYNIMLQDNSGDIIELLLHRNNQTVDVFINSILNTSFPSADSIYIQANNCAIWNTSDGCVLSFRSGFSMKVVYLTQ